MPPETPNADAQTVFTLEIAARTQNRSGKPPAIFNAENIKN
jgi:hypothetical protein